MSEVRNETTEIITKIKHSFYCDDCGALIHTSVEYEDGYFTEPRGFAIKNIKLKVYYCDKCGTKRCKDVTEYARSKNFDI